MNARTVFFVSDHTGITVELLGKGLLTQFPGLVFKHVTIPFIDTVDKACNLANHIAQVAKDDDARPLVFSTLTNLEVRQHLAESGALLLDLFDMFITPLEAELGTTAAPALGLAHGMGNQLNYARRIDAINFSLDHDDGARTARLGNADIILIGVSRSGKTPTCLYLALQYGLQAANFPLTPDDFVTGELPASLLPFRDKLFGLAIKPERLQQIRSERRPDSQYASLENCCQESKQAEALFRKENIPYLDTTSMSVEEIAVTVLQRTKLGRHK